MIEYITITSTLTILLVVLSVAAGFVLSEIFDGSGSCFFGPDTFVFCLLVLAGLTLAGLCNCACYAYGLKQERNKAVEAGVAYYRLDSKTGDTQFEYLEIKKEETNNE